MKNQSDSGEAIELCGITWDHPRGYQPLHASSRRYEEENNVRILWEKRSLKDFGDMPIKQLAEKYDLLVIDYPHIAIAAAESCLLKLDTLLDYNDLALFASQSVGRSYLSYNYDEHQWALPVDAACQVAAYRSDLFEGGIPQTWEAVFSLGSELRKEKRYIGMALCPTDCNCTFLTLSAQMEDAPRENKQELISMDKGVTILEHILKLKTVCHFDALDWNPIALYDYMTTHDDIIYSPLGFGYVNYAIDSGASRLKYAAIPGKSGALLGGAGIAISARCKNVDAAVDYVKWICGPEYQKTKYFEEGGQPAQMDAWMDTKANKDSNGFFLDTLETISLAYMRPRMLQWPVFQEYLGEMIHDFLMHNKNPKVTMTEINTVYKEMFWL